MCLAVPGKIEQIKENDNILMRTATVSFNDTLVEVNLSMLPEAQIGDYVLVHTGMALSVIDEEEAQKTFELLKEFDEISPRDDLEKN